MKKYFLALTFLFSLNVKAISMQPGLWKSSTSFKLNGIQLPAKESQGCVSVEEASDVKSTITSGLKKDGCELKKWDLKGTRLEAQVACENSDVTAEGTLHGTVTQKKYELEGEAKGTYKKAIPSEATIKLSGVWLQKVCKK